MALRNKSAAVWRCGNTSMPVYVPSPHTQRILPHCKTIIRAFSVKIKKKRVIGFYCVAFKVPCMCWTYTVLLFLGISGRGRGAPGGLILGKHPIKIGGMEMKKGLALLLTGLLAVTSIPAAAVDIGEVDMTKGTTDWNNPESYVYNNDTGVPDRGLYVAAVRSGDQNKDGLLTVAEAEVAEEITTSFGHDDDFIEVNSLKGIEYFKSLKCLWLYRASSLKYSKLTDLSPLQKLEHLEEFALSWNHEITDLGPLKNLDSLRNLQLMDTPNIRDFSPLKNTNITELHISNISSKNQLDGTNLVNTVKQMDKLAKIVLSGFVIPDAAPLLERPRLYLLSLNDCKVEKISEVSRPVSIEDLSYATTIPISWFPLSQMTNLEYLSIRDSNLTNLDGLEKLTKLGHLYLTDNKQLTTLPDLSGLSNLELVFMKFGGNQLSAEELTAKLPKHFQELSEWPEWLKDNADDVEDVPESILPKPGAQEDGSYVVNLDQPDQNDGHRFSVNLPEGMVDESKGLTLKVTPQTTSSAAVKAEAEKENCEIQHGFDLSLEYTDGTKVEYTPGKLMTVSIYSPEIMPGRAYRIFRENDDGSVDVIIPSYVGHGIMQFKTDHFSHYSWGIVKNAPVVPDRPSRPSGSSGGSYSYSSRIDENWIFVRSQGMGSVTPGDCTVYDGEDKTFTFMPDEGYKVGKVLLDGEEIPTDGKSYTLRDITAPHTLTVIFARDTADEASKPVDPVKPNVTENAQTGDAWWKLW